MSQSKNNVDEFMKFINDTRSGKYCDIPYIVEECRDLRVDVTCSETVTDSYNNVILYGITNG